MNVFDFGLLIFICVSIFCLTISILSEIQGAKREILAAIKDKQHSPDTTDAGAKL